MAYREKRPEEILEVDFNADKQQIQRAFRKKALETHPDQGGDVKQFKAVKNAKEKLLEERRFKKNPVSQETDLESYAREILENPERGTVFDYGEGHYFITVEHPRTRKPERLSIYGDLKVGIPVKDLFHHIADQTGSDLNYHEEVQKGDFTYVYGSLNGFNNISNSSKIDFELYVETSDTNPYFENGYIETECFEDGSTVEYSREDYKWTVTSDRKDIRKSKSFEDNENSLYLTELLEDRISRSFKSLKAETRSFSPRNSD